MTEQMFADLSERIVISWIERQSPPPASLRNILRQYQNLVVYIARVNDPAADHIMNSLYDAMLAEATRQAHTAIRIAAQARRLERRRESRLTWTERCNEAIRQYNEGVRA